MHHRFLRLLAHQNLLQVNELAATFSHSIEIIGAGVTRIRQDKGLSVGDESRLPPIEDGLRVEVRDQEMTTGPEDAATRGYCRPDIVHVTEGKSAHHQIELTRWKRQPILKRALQETNG
jgi:hypothetical protein